MSEPIDQFMGSLMPDTVRGLITHPGMSASTERFTAASFEALSREHGAREVDVASTNRNALAVFDGLAL